MFGFFWQAVYIWEPIQNESVKTVIYSGCELLNIRLGDYNRYNMSYLQISLYKLML